MLYTVLRVFSTKSLYVVIVSTRAKPFVVRSSGAAGGEVQGRKNCFQLCGNQNHVMHSRLWMFHGSPLVLPALT